MVLPEVKASGGIIQEELCRRVSSMLTWPLSEPARNAPYMVPCQDHDMLPPQEWLQHDAWMLAVTAPETAYCATGMLVQGHTTNPCTILNTAMKQAAYTSCKGVS